MSEWIMSEGLFPLVMTYFAAELMMAEAVGLVNTLDNWTVVDKIILSTKTPEKKRIFGKGNFQSLTGNGHFRCDSLPRLNTRVLI